MRKWVVTAPWPRGWPDGPKESGAAAQSRPLAAGRRAALRARRPVQRVPRLLSRSGLLAPHAAEPREPLALLPSVVRRARPSAALRHYSADPGALPAPPAPLLQEKRRVALTQEPDSAPPLLDGPVPPAHAPEPDSAQPGLRVAAPAP